MRGPRRSRGPPEGTGPRLAHLSDPLGLSLRRLNQKWTLLILRDMAFLRLSRFTEFLRNNPGLTPRVLSRRLKEMQEEALVSRIGTGRKVEYALTRRGDDAVFILLAYLRYGLKYHTSPRGDGGYSGEY